MKYRKLRIAFSVFCGLACVVLIVLWVRSHFAIEAIVYRGSGPIDISRTLVGVNNGTFQITHVWGRAAEKEARFPDGWSYAATTWDDATEWFFDWAFFPDAFVLQFPILLPALFIALVAWAISWWFRRRENSFPTT